MPMTVWRRDYFIELAGALRAADGDLRCFRLTACKHISEVEFSAAIQWKRRTAGVLHTCLAGWN